jgi:hypothetical protein
MPPLAPPGPVIKVAFETNTNAAINAGSRFFMRYSSGVPSGPDLATMAGAVSASWAANVAPIVDATESLVSVSCQDLSSDTGAEGTDTSVQNGTLTGGAPLPASTCAVVNHQIVRHFRGGRPRTYLRCGDDDTSHITGTYEWTTTFQGVILGAWEDWIAAILADGPYGGIVLTDIVNVSWYRGNAVIIGSTGRARNVPQRLVPPKVDSVTSSAVARKLGSQRRRLDF